VLHLFVTDPSSPISREVERLINSEEGLTDKALLFVYENFIHPNVNAEKQFEFIQRSQEHLDVIRTSAANSVELCSRTDRSKDQGSLIHSLTDNLSEILRRTNALEQELAASQTEIFTDSLTGISNRRYLEAEFLARRMRPHAPYFLALLDIDHFKRVNDTHGHIAGDQVLKLVAAAIKRMINEDDILCRYGGEEFVILFNTDDRDACVSVVETVRIGVAKHKLVNKRRGNTIGSVTLSAGLALVNPDDDFETALDRADRLLYQAKKAGRDLLVTQN
jgi:diguanylate cyclase